MNWTAWSKTKSRQEDKYGRKQLKHLRIIATSKVLEGARATLEIHTFLLSMLLRVIVKQLYADNCFSPSLLCLFLWAIYARPPANMCVCVCVCVYTCVFVCICVFACIRVSVCCVYVSVHKCLYMCLNSLMQVYVHTSVYACIIQSQNS